MSTYLINERKQMIRTQSSVIYERETGVDTLQFIIPTAIDGIDLAACACTLHTINMDCAGNVHNLDYTTNENFPNYLICMYTLRTEDTYKDGDVDIWLEFANEDQSIILKTAETKYTVTDHQIVADYLPDGQLDLLDEYLLKFSGIKSSIDNSAAHVKASEEYTKSLVDSAIAAESKAAKSASDAGDYAAQAMSCVDLADDAARAAGNSAEQAAKSAEEAARSAAQAANAEQFAQQSERDATSAKEYADKANASMTGAQDGASVAEKASSDATQAAKDAAQAAGAAEKYAKDTATIHNTTAHLVDVASISARDAAGYAEEARQILEQIKQMMNG